MSLTDVRIIDILQNHTPENVSTGWGWGGVL